MTISSGIGSPLPVVITRLDPSTTASVMPGHHSGRRRGSPTSSQTLSGGQAIRTWRRTVPRVMAAPPGRTRAPWSP